MERLGLISFQANDKSDVFHVAEVRENDVELSDETLFGTEDPQFESGAAWETGNVPRFKEVNLEGDNVFLQAWLKGEKFDRVYTLRIYVEYEEAEEFVEEELEMKESIESELDSQEIQL